MKNIDEELINKEKRKTESLTTKEWLTFFIFPVNPNSRLNSKSANQFEYEWFKRFGFEKKMKQVETVQVAGVLFYICIFIIIIFEF